MGNKKVVFKFFTVPAYRQEEEYLGSMHEKGWKLTKVTFPGFFHFEKCEPGKVTYRLDYNPEGKKAKTEYVQMFSDCGWEYLFDFVGFSYFCKEGGSNQASEEIFSDDSSRHDMMKRVFKVRITLSIIIWLMALCIGICFHFTNRSVYSISENGDGFSIEAERLNTSVVVEYGLKKGDMIAVSHEYDGGEIFIRIGEENKEPIFYGNSYNGMGDFMVGIEEDGKYKIECSGRRAKGVIRFVIKEQMF